MLSATIDALLHRIRQANVQQLPLHDRTWAQSIVAFSGGVDSSLVVYLVHRVFPKTSTAILGISPAVSMHQIEQAQKIANKIGILLVECNTTEWEDEKYVQNQGKRLPNAVYLSLEIDQIS